MASVLRKCLKEKSVAQLRAIAQQIGEEGHGKHRTKETLISWLLQQDRKAVQKAAGLSWFDVHKAVAWCTLIGTPIGIVIAGCGAWIAWGGNEQPDVAETGQRKSRDDLQPTALADPHPSSEVSFAEFGSLLSQSQKTRTLSELENRFRLHRVTWRGIIVSTHTHDDESRRYYVIRHGDGATESTYAACYLDPKAEFRSYSPGEEVTIRGFLSGVDLDGVTLTACVGLRDWPSGQTGQAER